MTTVYFNGEEGRLEGKYHHSTNTEPQVALILHSEPQNGGSMEDPIVDEIYKLLSKRNFSVLKINFRGVGRSEGISTKEEGEMRDATIAMDWLHSKNMESKDYWIIGFSFGAWIAFQLVMRRPEIQEYVLISPMAKKDFGFIVPCEASGIVIQGESDKTTPEENTAKLVEKLSVKEGLDVEYIVVENADHAFEGNLDKLKEIISDYINKKIVENLGRVIKVKRDRRRRRRKKIEMEENAVIHISPVSKIDFD
jgi:alpha/beta superfamily hydrolase